MPYHFCGTGFPQFFRDPKRYRAEIPWKHGIQYHTLEVRHPVYTGNMKQFRKKNFREKLNINKRFCWKFIFSQSTGSFNHINTSTVDCADDGRFSGFDSVQNKPRKAVYPVVVILAKRFCCAYKEAQKLERETGTDFPVKQI